MAKIKLWYQNMSRQKAWSAYSIALPKIFNRVKDPGTEIGVHGITKVGGYENDERPARLYADRCHRYATVNGLRAASTERESFPLRT